MTFYSLYKDSIIVYVSGGDPRAEFQIEDAGEVKLAKKLNSEIQTKYNLTISVTNGIRTVSTQVSIHRLESHSASDNDSR